MTKSILNPGQLITGVPAGAANENILEWSVQIGPKQWPESIPASNIAETFSLLKQAIGTYDESIRSVAITDATPRLNNFCIGVPLQIIVNQPFSSTSTRSGDLVTVHLRNLNGDSRQAGRIFCHMVAETLVEIRESGVSVLD